MKKTFFVFPFVLFFLSGCGEDLFVSDQYKNIPEVKIEDTKVISPKIVEFSATPTSEVPVSPIYSSSTTSTMKSEVSKPISYIATLHTTEGDIEITLNNNQTPKTVENFVKLSKKNFYDNTIFHRVIKGFMMQGGDPTGTGMGGPGYQFDDEPFTGEYTRGTVAMANAGPNTNGSQFFILQAAYNPPSSDYVIFGHVSKGMEVVDTIVNAPVEISGRERSKPINPVKIKSVTIVEK